MKIKQLINILNHLANHKPDAEIVVFSPNSGLSKAIIVDEATARFEQLHHTTGRIPVKQEIVFVLTHLKGE